MPNFILLHRQLPPQSCKIAAKADIEAELLFLRDDGDYHSAKHIRHIRHLLKALETYHNLQTNVVISLS